MTCGLGEEELFILEILFKHRNFKQSSGFHHELLAKLFRRNFKNRDPDRHLKKLLNDGYVGRIGKSPYKYYCDGKKTAIALGHHGRNVTMGREIKL